MSIERLKRVSRRSQRRDIIYNTKDGNKLIIIYLTTDKPSEASKDLIYWSGYNCLFTNFNRHKTHERDVASKKQPVSS